MTEKRLKIGLVGCGVWGSLILRDLVALDCDVTVVARSTASCNRAAERGAARIISSVPELGEVSAVVVCVPISRHFAVISEVLDLYPNFPIFTEKPLVDKVEEAETLFSRAAANLFVMDKWRYHPGVLQLAEIARSRELGQVIGLSTVRVAWGNRHPDTDPVWMLLPHDLAIVGEVLGSIPEPFSAIADCVAGVPCGMTALLRDRDEASLPWAICQVSARSPNKIRSVHLYCEHGVAMLSDAYAENLEIARHRASTPDRPEIERRNVL